MFERAPLLALACVASLLTAGCGLCRPGGFADPRPGGFQLRPGMITLPPGAIPGQWEFRNAQGGTDLSTSHDGVTVRLTLHAREVDVRFENTNEARVRFPVAEMLFVDPDGVGHPLSSSRTPPTAGAPNVPVILVFPGVAAVDSFAPADHWRRNSETLDWETSAFMSAANEGKLHRFLFTGYAEGGTTPMTFEVTYVPVQVKQPEAPASGAPAAPATTPVPATSAT